MRLETFIISKLIVSIIDTFFSLLVRKYRLLSFWVGVRLSTGCFSYEIDKALPGLFSYLLTTHNVEDNRPALPQNYP